MKIQYTSASFGLFWKIASISSQQEKQLKSIARHNITCFRAADVLYDRLDGLAGWILGAQLMGQQAVEDGAGRLAMM